MAEGEQVTVIASGLKTKGDKARAIADMGQEMLQRGFTHTQSSNTAEHEIKHALADSGEGEVSLKQRGGLTIPTYSSVGNRTNEEKIRIALAPKNPSPTDLEAVADASKPKKKKFLGLF